MAADVSLTYKNVAANQEGWTFGFVLSNLGTKIGYTNDATQKEYIPANMGLGANYTKVFDEENKISFGLDLNKLLVPASSVKDPMVQTLQTEQINDYYNQSVVSSWFKSLTVSLIPSMLLSEQSIHITTSLLFVSDIFMKIKTRADGSISPWVSD